MSTNRRALTALLPAALALAGCATIEKATGTTTPEAAVQAVYNKTAFLLPLLDALAVGLSIAVPPAAPALSSAMAVLNNDAGPIFQQLVTTMTQVDAQPLVKQIEGYASTAFSSIRTVVASSPSLSKDADLQGRLAQAQTVLDLLSAFANGVTAGPALAARYGHQAVALPLAHR